MDRKPLPLLLAKYDLSRHVNTEHVSRNNS